MDFEKICMMFTMQEPFYGILLSSMLRKPFPAIKTAGVRRSGNVFELLYNENWIKKLSVQQTLVILKHEVLHIAFGHLSMWGDDRPSELVRELRNKAEDLEINGYLDKDIIKSLNGQLPEKYCWEDFAGTREYYDRLLDLNNKSKNKKVSSVTTVSGTSGSDDCKSECDSNNEDQDQTKEQEQPISPTEPEEEADEIKDDINPMPQQALADADDEDEELCQEILDNGEDFDDHSMWPNCTEEETQELQQAIDTLLDFAAQEVEKNHGTIPREMIGKIEMIRNKPKPVADWKRYFRRYLGNEFTEILRKSKKRESKRFPDAAGNRHQRKSSILVAIDTSGSVSIPEYNEFFGQVKTLTTKANFHVVECDTVIHHEYDYKNKPNDNLHGGGGTSFQEPIDMFIKNRKKYDALVYFTDGYADIPNNTPKETLWVISSDGNIDRKRYQVNGAKVVFIPKHN